MPNYLAEARRIVLPPDRSLQPIRRFPVHLIHRLEDLCPELFHLNPNIRFHVWEHVIVRQSMKECFGGKLTLAMNMPNLKSLEMEVVFDTVHGWYYECRAFLLGHIIATIRS